MSFLYIKYTSIKTASLPNNDNNIQSLHEVHTINKDKIGNIVIYMWICHFDIMNIII